MGNPIRLSSQQCICPSYTSLDQFIYLDPLSHMYSGSLSFATKPIFLCMDQDSHDRPSSYRQSPSAYLLLLTGFLSLFRICLSPLYHLHAEHYYHASLTIVWEYTYTNPFLKIPNHFLFLLSYRDLFYFLSFILLGQFLSFFLLKIPSNFINVHPCNAVLS